MMRAMAAAPANVPATAYDPADRPPARHYDPPEPFWPALLLALLSVAFLIGALRHAGQPADDLLTSVALDETAVRLQPALNALAAGDWSFDGEVRAEGAEPLWALVTLGLAAVTPDDTAALRAMIALGAMCWLAAAWILFGAFCGRQPAFAALAGALWLYAGASGGLAFRGLENGVQALVLASVLAWATRPADRPSGTGRLLLLGALCGLFALAHIEGVLLAALILVAVLQGSIAAVRATADGANGEGTGFGARLRDAAVFAAPVVLLLGGWLGFRWWYFGSPTPLDLEVALLREQGSAGPAPDALASLSFARDAMLAAATAGPRLTAQEVGSWLGATPPEDAVLSWSAAVLAVGLVLVAARIWWRWRLECRGAPSEVHGAVLVYALAHLALWALVLPRTGWQRPSWFAPELLATSMILAGAVHALSPWSGRAAGWTSIAATALLCLPIGHLAAGPPPAAAPAPAVRAGQWLAAHVPAGARIAAPAGGLLALTADGHTVVDLGGTAGDRGYVDGNLRTDQVPDYLRTRGIGWFAGEFAEADLGEGIAWHGSIPPAELALACWWPLDGPDSEPRAYCLFRLWPEASGGAPADPFAQLQFRALVRGEFATAVELPEPDDGRMVATSVVRTPSLQVHHVLMTPAEYLALAPAAATVPIGRTAAAGDHGAVRCLGVDLQTLRGPDGPVVAATRYWQWLDASRAVDSVEAALRLGEGADADRHRGPLLHGTLRGPVPAGTVLSDLVLLPVAAARAGQTLPVHLRLLDRVPGAVEAGASGADGGEPVVAGAEPAAAGTAAGSGEPGSRAEPGIWFGNLRLPSR